MQRRHCRTFFLLPCSAGANCAGNTLLCEPFGCRLRCYWHDIVDAERCRGRVTCIHAWRCGLELQGICVVVPWFDATVRFSRGVQAPKPSASASAAGTRGSTMVTYRRSTRGSATRRRSAQRRVRCRLVCGRVVAWCRTKFRHACAFPSQAPRSWASAAMSTWSPVVLTITVRCVDRVADAVWLILGWR